MRFPIRYRFYWHIVVLTGLLLFASRAAAQTLETLSLVIEAPGVIETSGLTVELTAYVDYTIVPDGLEAATLTYQLPDAATVISAENGEIDEESGTLVWTEIEGSGRLTVSLSIETQGQSVDILHKATLVLPADDGDQQFVTQNITKIRAPLATPVSTEPALPTPLTIQRAPLRFEVSDDDTWTLPLNLSQAGSGTAPKLLTDQDGNLHVIWLDLIAGPMHIMWNGRVWSRPQSIPVPFAPFEPLLRVGTDNTIHAIWRDFKENLYYSSVSAENLGEGGAWSTIRLIRQQVKAADLQIDAQNEPHIVYIRNESENALTAAIEHRAADNQHTIVDVSPYLRSVQSADANIDFALVDDQLYLAWDNPQLGRVMAARSQDGGQTWSTPLVVDARDAEDSPLSNRPAQIRVFAAQENVIIAWHAGHLDTICGQYYRVSVDGGATFAPSELLFGDLLECPTDSQLVAADDGNFLLLTETTDWTYLAQWYEGEWRDQAIQLPLVQFIDPTTFLDVEMGCYTSTILSDALYVAGCDDGEGQDIWIVRQGLDTALREQFFERTVSGAATSVATTAADPTPFRTRAPLTFDTDQSIEPNQDNTRLVVGAILLVGVGITLIGVRNTLKQ